MAALTISRLIDSGLGPEWAGSYLGRSFGTTGSLSQFKKKKATYGSAVGPTAAYGVDVLYAEVLTVPASGTVSLDLTAVKDVSGQTQSWARLKALWALLLGTDDNGGISVQASSVTIAPGATNGHLLFLNASTNKYRLVPGRRLAVEDFTASGDVVSSTLKTVDVVNADSVNAATLALVLAGGLT